MKKLHVVNEGLKKFAHVNKKAFEQYNNFTKQRDTLLQRREDLDKSAQSIEELVEVLDQRKDEAIERTFKQVASNFEEVFEKLVPVGRGRLIIQRRIDQVSIVTYTRATTMLMLFYRMKTRLRRVMKLSKVQLITTPVSLSRSSRLSMRDPLLLKPPSRSPSIRKLTKGFGYNSCLVVKSHWLH